MHQYPGDPIYAQKEYDLTRALQEEKHNYNSFMHQRAKISLLRYGDDNTSIFHHSINQRRIHNRVNFLIMNDTFITDPAIIQRSFHDFYSDLLCCEFENRKQIQLQTIREGCILNQEQKDLLNLSFSA